MKKRLIFLVLLFTIANQISMYSEHKIELMMKQAISMFKSWETGEGGDSYSYFLKYLRVEDFKYFSHPLVGEFSGKEAFEKLIKLIQQRESSPNQLKFSNILTYQNGNKFCFQFDSEGKVSGGFNYKGFNIIQIEIKEGKLVGFKEYFGYINPEWFK